MGNILEYFLLSEKYSGPVSWRSVRLDTLIRLAYESFFFPLSRRLVMFRKLLGVALFCSGACVFAQQSSNFSVTVGTAVLCLDDIDPGYFYNYLRKTKPSARREQGAYWFTVKETLFGIPLKEVFVSDGSSEYSFIGALTLLTPDQLANALAENAPAGGNFKKINPRDKYSVYVSSPGAIIAFQGKFGKVFCRRDKVRRSE